MPKFIVNTIEWIGDILSSSYLKRISDEKLELLLRAKGAVLIEGPKWCGKTSSAEELSNSALYMQDPDTAKANKLVAQNKPSLLLEGETPRLLDEWQVAPELWNAVRFAIDKRKATGQFILTGLVAPTRTKDMHTGTGRIARMRMHTMSLFESGDSSGDVSLKALFDRDETFEGHSDISIEKLAFLINRGDWPAVTGDTNERIALAVAADYYEAIANEDVSKVDNIEKNPDKLLDLRIYADSIDGRIYHYRDKSGLEVDAIIQLDDGRWAAVGVKMGMGEVESAAENLLRLNNVVDTDKMLKPSFLMVLTATEYAFQLKNGVHVVPLGCLKN